MKKFTKQTLCVLLASSMGLSIAACGEAENSGEGSSVCEVKAAVAGYGTDWLRESARVFNETYKSEGYEVKITLEDTNIGMANEILTPKRNTTDLYIEYTMRINTAIDKSRSILGAGKGALLEELSDVLNAKAIGTNKQEVGEAIKDRLGSEILQNYEYSGKAKGYDGIYGVPVYGGTTGVYVNTKVLEQKGYSLDDLLTTNGIVDITEALAPQGGDRLDATKFFPVTWSGQSSYWSYLYDMLVAQYMGKNGYYNFLQFIPENGETQKLSSGYTVYENRGIYESFKVAEELLNKDYSVPGTTSDDHIKAQARLFEGRALFMVSGDWIYKEMEQHYSQYFNDIMPIKTPILSALGVKLGLCGTTHTEPAYNSDPFVDAYTCDNCESKLRAIIKMVDENEKTDAEIASALGVTEQQVSTIRERRGYYDVSNDWAAMIPSYSNAKAVAKEFLKFLYSDEALQIYYDNTNAHFITGFVDSNKANFDKKGSIMYDRLHGVASTQLDFSNYDEIRLYNGLTKFPAAVNDKTLISNLSYSHTDYPSYNKAKDCYLKEITTSKANWGDWLATAGLAE